MFSARCGREALQVLEKQSVDLIITDYRMSPVNGLELIARVRQGSQALPVVLLTGFAESMGLTPENVGQAVRKVQPYAVDVSSGVEAEPGMKDHEKMKAFVQAAKMS